MPQVTAEHIYQKAVSVLAEHLEPIDLLFLQECINLDEESGFHRELTRVAAQMYPEFSALGKTAPDLDREYEMSPDQVHDEE